MIRFRRFRGFTRFRRFTGSRVQEVHGVQRFTGFTRFTGSRGSEVHGVHRFTGSGGLQLQNFLNRLNLLNP
jgi:hypothetical protein